MLLDLLTAAAIVGGLLAALFSVVSPFDGATAAVIDMTDLQQRRRGAVLTLYRDLAAAGGGPYGSADVSLVHLRPAVAPSRRGVRTHGPSRDQVSVLAARSDGRATLLAPILSSPSRVPIGPGPGCGRAPCGLSPSRGGLAVVFDRAGRSDLVRVLTATRHHAVVAPLDGAALRYPAGAGLVAVTLRTYYFDAARRQLRLYDGAESDAPILDDVTGFMVRYYGDTALGGLRRRYRGATPTAPCLVVADPGLATAPVWRELSVDTFNDGPWCGRSVDADLFRIRRVRVDVTFGYRGRDRTASDRVRLDVVPRSLVSW